MTWMLWLLAVAPPPDLAAVGVVTSAHTGRSVAILRAAGRSRVVAVGDSAFGGQVSAIESGRVVIEFEGQPVELRLPRAQPAKSIAPVVAAAHEPAADGVTLDRRELERRLASETSRILAETTLTPVTSGSQVTGFALSRIPEGSILSDAGLRAGD